MTNIEMKNLVKVNKQEVAELEKGMKVRHNISNYVAEIEKVYSNGRVDMVVIEEDNKPCNWRMAFKCAITPYANEVHTFKQCYSLI